MVTYLSEVIVAEPVIVDLLRDRCPAELEMRRGLIEDLGPEGPSGTLLNDSPHQLRVVAWHYLEFVEFPSVSVKGGGMLV